MNQNLDIVILYHTEDNLADTGVANGWVDNFKYFLQLMLNQVLGSEFSIKLINQNDIDSMALSPKAILPILSSSYLKSGSLVDVLQNNNSKILKILKNPLSTDEQPDSVKQNFGYNLYKVDLISGETEDFNDFFGHFAERYYWSKIADLAYEIHSSIKSKDSSDVLINQENSLNIFLAEVSYDLRFQQSLIKRELERYGHNVYPKETIPAEYDAVVSTSKKDIDLCQMTIHLIGDHYGEVFKENDQSIFEIQNKISASKAAKINNKGEFSRLVWVKELNKSASERQHSFIDSIKRDNDTSDSSEILLTPFEDFKNIVRQKIAGIVATSKRVIEKNLNGHPKVYILHDKDDQENIDLIKSAVESAGYKTLLPSFKGELMQLREQHLDHLREFDTAIIYKGQVSQQWVMMKMLDVLKAPGLGRKKPLKGKFIISDKRTDLGAEELLNDNFTFIETSKIGSLEKILKNLS